MRSSLIIIAFFTLFIIVFSCEPGDINLDVDCSKCYTSKPDSADILIKLTFNDRNQSIPLIVYRGKIDENVVEWTDTAYSKAYPDGKYYLYSPVNKYYSVKATYLTKKGTTVIAVDGDRLSTRHVTDACNTDCYTIKGGILDVRLKYE